MRRRGQRRAIAFGVAIAAISVAFAATGAAASERVLMSIRVHEVTLRSGGAVRVDGSYTCPLRYAPRYRTDEVIQVWQPGRPELAANASIRHVVCDGTPQPFSHGFRTAASGARWRRALPIVAKVYMNVVGRRAAVSAVHYRSTTAESDADVRVIAARFASADAIRIRGRYRCPEGTVSHSYVSVWQRGTYRERSIARLVSCDAASHRLSVKLRHADRFNPDRILGVDLAFSVSRPDGVVSAGDAEALIGR
jgi:hypothetical protein